MSNCTPKYAEHRISSLETTITATDVRQKLFTILFTKSSHNSDSLKTRLKCEFADRKVLSGEKSHPVLVSKFYADYIKKARSQRNNYYSIPFTAPVRIYLSRYRSIQYLLLLFAGLATNDLSTFRVADRIRTLRRRIRRYGRELASYTLSYFIFPLISSFWAVIFFVFLFHFYYDFRHSGHNLSVFELSLCRLVGIRMIPLDRPARRHGIQSRT